MISKVLKRFVPQIKSNQSWVSIKAIANGSNAARFSSISQLNEDEIVFPREKDGLNYALNWALAKSLVTPFNLVHHNKSKNGSQDSSSTTVKSVGKEFDAKTFGAAQRRLAKVFSKCDNLFVEEGTLGGLHVRIVCGSSEQANLARGALESSGAQGTAHATVLFGKDDSLNGLTVVDVERKVILTDGVNRSSLTEALQKLVAK